MSTRSFTRMLRLALPLVAGGAAPAEPAYPPRAVVLFVADWCAPCHAEVARLPEIAAAAGAWTVLVADGDAPARPGRLARGVKAERRWTPDPATAAAIRRDLFADIAGLPYAVAFDAAGRRCADTRRGLDAARTRALLERCAPG